MTSQFEKLKVAADLGDTKAMFDLAQMFESGTAGGKQNLRIAAGYYRRAAESGHVQSQMTMAKLCLLGKGVRQDAEEAAQWYLKAAELGNLSACENLAEMYARGRGVAKDEEKAEFWHRRATGET